MRLPFALLPAAFVQVTGVHIETERKAIELNWL
jgi:hypothetical protein